jgi:uroporphyrinogen-III synthase
MFRENMAFFSAVIVYSGKTAQLFMSFFISKFLAIKILDFYNHVYKKDA